MPAGPTFRRIPRSRINELNYYFFTTKNLVRSQDPQVFRTIKLSNINYSNIQPATNTPVRVVARQLVNYYRSLGYRIASQYGMLNNPEDKDMWELAKEIFNGHGPI